MKSNGVEAEFADPIRRRRDWHSTCRSKTTAGPSLLQTPSDDRNRHETRAIAPLMRSSTARFDWVRTSSTLCGTSAGVSGKLAVRRMGQQRLLPELLDFRD